MSRLKDETLSIRTSAEIKPDSTLWLLSASAARVRPRSIKILVLEYARTHGLKTRSSR